MKITFTFLLIGLTICSFAQSTDIQAQEALNDLGNLSNRATGVVVPPESKINYDIQGSQFFYTEMKEGCVQFYDANSCIDNIKLKWDILNSIFYAEQRETTYKLNQIEVKRIEIQGDNERHIIYNGGHYDNNFNGTFFEKRHTENDKVLLLLRKKDKKINDATQAYGATRNEIVFKDVKTYFIFDGSRIIEVNRKKDVENNFPALKGVKIKSSRLDDEDYLIELLKKI